MVEPGMQNQEMAPGSNQGPGLQAPRFAIFNLRLILSTTRWLLAYRHLTFTPAERKRDGRKDADTMDIGRHD